MNQLIFDDPSIQIRLSASREEVYGATLKTLVNSLRKLCKEKIIGYSSLDGVIVEVGEGTNKFISSLMEVEDEVRIVFLHSRGTFSTDPQFLSELSEATLKEVLLSWKGDLFCG